METNANALAKKIPDFDDMLKLADEIAELLFKKLILDKEIKTAEAEVVRKATTEEQYFIGGKPPTYSFIDSTYKYTGLNKELIPLREEQAKVISELERAKTKYDIFGEMLDVFRTVSANERRI